MNKHLRSALYGFIAGILTVTGLYSVRNTPLVVQSIALISQPIVRARERERNSDLIQAIQSDLYPKPEDFGGSATIPSNPLAAYKELRQQLDAIADNDSEKNDIYSKTTAAAWMAFSQNPSDAFSSGDRYLIADAANYAKSKCSRKLPEACYSAARILADKRNSNPDFATSRGIILTRAKKKAAGYKPMEEALKQLVKAPTQEPVTPRH